MERENFYILLELPVDPPESDLKRIEAAIAKKQAEWSRLRNHPTKGLQAQKWIAMIPEIRKVMTDPLLRQQEAEAARQNAERDKVGKVTEIDRHIDILTGKGFVSKEEIVKLAKRHNMTEEEIQTRIRIKKAEKFVTIDRQLSLRMAKGYITEDEIKKLAHRHNLKPEDVKARVYMPMLKSDKEKNILPARQLDKSIEKSIRENLGIVDKASLYDFLGLHESANLEDLQKATIEKKKQLANTGKKDAEVTAGNTLTGHCTTIFKNEDSRIAYDISLAKSRLSELDSDIDISGFNGKIRHEYFEILVRKAMDFGMEKKEAEQYIKDYCKQKNWTITQPAGKKRSLVIMGAIIGIILVAVSTLGAFYLNHRQEQKRQSDYAAFTERVNAQDELQAEINLLKQYISEHQADTEYEEFVDDARERIAERRSKIAEKEYAEMTEEADALVRDEEFEAAKSRINNYLETDPPKKYAAKAREDLTDVNAMVEENDFEKLSSIVIEAGTSEKIQAITDYMDKHPDGKNIDAVRDMLADMSNEYYIYVKKALESAEAKQDWQKCVDIAQSYTDLYDNSYADKLKPKIDEYRQKVRQDRIFKSLQQQAQKFGDDFEAARSVYRDYLSAYPDTPIKERIKAEIVKLDEQADEAAVENAKARMRDLIDESGDRFVSEESEVVVDNRTGLMWTLLDSDVKISRDCLTYDQATEYTDNLSTGGYSDWRIPTAAELKDLYDTDPAFPVTEEKWYWSAKSYSSYSDGWYKVVDTVRVFPDGTIEESRRDSHECGTIKAVRSQ